MTFFFTWYKRLHFKELSTVHLHLHCVFVQHPNIVSTQEEKGHDEHTYTHTKACAQHLVFLKEKNKKKLTCKGCCILKTLFQNCFQHTTVCLIQPPRANTHNTWHRVADCRTMQCVSVFPDEKYQMLRLSYYYYNYSSYQHSPGFFPRMTLV